MSTDRILLIIVSALVAGMLFQLVAPSGQLVVLQGGRAAA